MNPVEINESSQKRECVSLKDVLFLTITGRRSLCVSFITNLKLNSCTVKTTQNTAERKCTISHAQNTSNSA